jgi:CRISPR-associated protein Cmr2
VASERRCPLSADATQADRDELDALLKKIYDAETESGRRLGPPPAFYALLLADGDRMGDLVARLGGPTVSRALASFTGRVTGIVDGHDGVTVYAGGDDVLAMLPATGALQCANALAESFRAAFPETGTENQASLSAAVVFSHVRLPLRSVLHEAHYLLGDVAKEGNGRNSLATSVVKPGGRHAQWVTTWTRRAANGARAVTLIEGLVRQLETNTATPGLSSSLVYRIRELLTTLCGWDRWQPGDWRKVPAGLDLRPFLHAEIVQSLDVRTEDQMVQRAGNLTERVCALLDRSHVIGAGVAGVGLDALVLARFLADREQQEFER